MRFSLLVRMAWEKEMNNKQHTTTAGEDYLESVLILQKKLGMVRSVDVARYMEVSKPSVDPETAEADACRIEHDISAETYERLKESVTKE